MGAVFSKNINQNLFKTWTPEMSYILGYITADGCILVSKDRKKHPFTLNITSVNLKHLYKIRKILKSEHKIGKKSWRGNIAYQLQIGMPIKSIHEVIDKREKKKMIQFNTHFYIDDCDKIADFMYGNNPVLYLPRKRKIFERWKSIKRRHYLKQNYPSKIGWYLNQKVFV